jgi:hypothetical protein
MRPADDNSSNFTGVAEKNGEVGSLGACHNYTLGLGADFVASIALGHPFHCKP